MERMDWIQKMYNKYHKDNSIKCHIDLRTGVTEVIQTESRYAKKIGLSYCNPSDKFVKKIGIALAYARCIGENIPDYVLNNKIMVKDVRIGGMFILKFNHKTYVKICEHPSYPNEYECTCIENGEAAIISDDSEIEKIF